MSCCSGNQVRASGSAGAVYAKKSPHSFEETVTRFVEAVKANGFGVIHQHSIDGMLQSKGFPLRERATVFEVCNPKVAAKVLNEQIDVVSALPCRISVFTDKGAVVVHMITPPAMFSLFAIPQEKMEALGGVAQDVDRITTKIVDDTCAAAPVHVAPAVGAVAAATHVEPVAAKPADAAAAPAPAAAAAH
jgi:uncharacterized protein (DUF302 family)